MVESAQDHEAAKPRTAPLPVGVVDLENWAIGLLVALNPSRGQKIYILPRGRNPPRLYTRNRNSRETRGRTQEHKSYTLPRIRVPGCGAAQRRHVARRNSETTSMAHIGGRIGSYRRDGRVAEPDRHPPEPILTRSPTSAPQNKPSSNVRLRTSLVPSFPRLCQVGGAKPVSGRSDPPYRYINKRTLNVGGGKKL